MKSVFAVGLLLLGFLSGILVGQYWLLREKDRWITDWRAESAVRLNVVELALTLAMKNKYDEEAKRAEAGRLLRAREDGRK